MQLAVLSVLWVAQCTLLTCASALTLVERTPASPTPLSIAPSQNWDGDDGPWSSFTLQVGTPAQNVRVLISGASPDTWVVRSDGCLVSDSGCLESRGRMFNPNTSSTWSQHGYYQLGVEQNLGVSVQGVFGNETLGLGIQGSGGPLLQDQIVAAYTSDDLYVGMFGVNPAPTNFTPTDQGRPSYMSSLRQQNFIPSLSFAYTAGNQYRLKQVFASLTLGGYDSSLFTPNGLSMPVATDPSRKFMVGIQSINSKNQNGTDAALLQTGIMANIDSTDPTIWLPLEACHAFEKAFGLTWDPKTEVYLVNTTLHSALVDQNATITFTLGITASGGPTTDITLPYNSFDLLATPPAFNITASQRYFPLRRAANDNQYTLGRAFLQETYLIVDWERQNFSISQCVFSENSQQQLVAINSTNPTPSSSSSSSSGSSSNKGKTVGVAVGVSVAAVIILGAIAAFFFVRRRKRRNQASEKAKAQEDPAEVIRQGFAKGELGTGLDNQRYEMAGSETYKNKNESQTSMQGWVDEKARRPGDRTGMAEADGGVVSRPELAEQSVLSGPLHEMYDPSSSHHPVELPADQPRELFGSTPPTSNRSSVASPIESRSPLSKPASPLSQPSTHPSPLNPQSGRATHPQSSFLGSLRNRSLPPSPPSLPSAPSSSQRSNAASSPTHATFSPVSRQGTFSSPDRSGTSQSSGMLSPISPERPHPQGLFGRLMRRS